MQFRTLGNTDLQVSILGFGASALGSVFGPINEDDGVRAVYAAIDGGINILDVSPAYGETKAETVLGKALKGIPRDSYFLSTKGGKSSDTKFDFSKEGIIRGLHESLRRLNVEYVDIFLLHDVEYQAMRFLPQALSEGFEALHTLKAQGKIRYFGFSAYPVSVFKEYLPQLTVDVVLCHSHYSLNDMQLLDLIPLVKERGIGLINAAPLGGGLLTKNGPSWWHPASPEEKAIVQQAVQYAAQFGQPLEKLAIQFSTSHPDISTTLVSGATVEIVRNNIAWLSEPLNPELVQGIQHILQPLMNKNWDFGNLTWTK